MTHLDQSCLPAPAGGFLNRRAQKTSLIRQEVCQLHRPKMAKKAKAATPAAAPVAKKTKAAKQAAVKAETKKPPPKKARHFQRDAVDSACSLLRNHSMLVMEMALY